MTEKQFEQYREIKEELTMLKEFLTWCGEKYSDQVATHCRARLIGRKVSISIGRKGYGFLRDTEILLPKELQKSIVDVIEQYVDRREKELEEI